MESFTRENGSSQIHLALGWDAESSDGLMALGMKVIGARGKHGVLVDSSMPMVTATRASGEKVKPVDKESTCMQMAADT